MWGHLKIFFLRTMTPEKLNFKWKLSYIYEGKLVKIMAPEGQMGQMEMKCIFDIGKIFIYRPSFLRWAMWPMGLLFCKMCRLSLSPCHTCGDSSRSHGVLSLFGFFFRTRRDRRPKRHFWGKKPNLLVFVRQPWRYLRMHCDCLWSVGV
jgi:hypothetical protein